MNICIISIVLPRLFCGVSDEKCGVVKTTEAPGWRLEVSVGVHFADNYLGDNGISKQWYKDKHLFHKNYTNFVPRVISLTVTYTQLLLLLTQSAKNSLRIGPWKLVKFCVCSLDNEFYRYIYNFQTTFQRCYLYSDVRQSLFIDPCWMN